MKDEARIKLISAQCSVASICPPTPEDIERKVIKVFKGADKGLRIEKKDALSEVADVASYISDVVQSLQTPGLTEKQRNDLFSVALERIGPENDTKNFEFGLKKGMKN